MKKLIIGVFVAVFGAANVAFAKSYYVDANFGNDAWDGTTPAIPSQEVIDAGGTISGPRKTLHAMMSDERVEPGDVVCAAEGDYNDGGDVNGSNATSNRVQVKAGVTLKATGSRDATYITGSGGTYAAGAVRCVFFIAPPSKATYGYGIVKGFTLRDGRTATSSEYGGAATGNGLLVECDFQKNGCYSTSRGGTLNQSTALRCCFTSYDRGYPGYSAVKIIDSLVMVGSSFYSSCKAYNCTFSGNGYVRQNGSSYNCLFLGTGAGSSSQDNDYHYTSYSRTDFQSDPEKCITNETCRVVTAEETPYDAVTFRPLTGSVAINAGSLSDYALATNGWKEAWLAECGKDYYGGDRVVAGAIDVGCGEKQEGSLLTITDESDGLVIVGAEKGEVLIPKGEAKDIIFSRTMTSDRLCLGVTVNGEFHSFGGTTSDVPYSVTLPAQFNCDYTIAAVYETDQKDWYVSPTGNNANKGYHRNCPRKTLDKAMELASEDAGHVVHAAAGVYDSFAEGADARSRVTVKSGVGLVADEWPLKETVIVGASDTTEDADANGNGPHAVRCVTVSSGAYVRGFKLTGGRTVLTPDSSARGGGAYNSGAIVDCEVTGNACAYRGRQVYGSGSIIRCYVHDPATGGSYDVYNGRVINSYIKGGYYGSSVVLNSTVTEAVRKGGAGIKAINTYLHNATMGTVCTNCVFTVSAGSAVDSSSSYDPDTCRFSAALADNLDENFRPKTVASPLVDFGSRELYDACFPAGWVQFKDLDIADGQRIYNGKIDVGCGEYDWRGDFAKKLSGGGSVLAVEVASADVTTNAVAGVDLADGDTLTFALKMRGGKASFKVVPDGAGEVTVMLGDTQLFPVGNVYTFDNARGGKRVTIAYAGEGKATVSDFVLPTGLILLFR